MKNNILFILLLTLAYTFDIDVYRQFYLEVGSDSFGTKVAQFQLLTTHWTKGSTRKISLIKLSEIQDNNLDILSKKVGALLIILDQENTQAWEIIQKLNNPIYFTYPNDQLSKFYTTLSTDNSQEYQMQVSSTDVKHQLQMEDFYAMIEGISSFKQNNPTTLFVLNVDSDLPSAEIIPPSQGMQYQLFFKLIRASRYFNRKDRNVIFYFAFTNSVEQFGLKHFLKKQEHARIASTIDQVIVLDQIYPDQELIIQYSNANLDKLKDYKIEKIPQQVSNKDIAYYFISTSQRASLFPHQLDDKLFQKLLKLIFIDIAKITDDSDLFSSCLTNTQKQPDTEFSLFNDSLFEEEIKVFFNSTNTHPVNLQKDSKFNSELFSLLKQLFKHTAKVSYQVKERKYHTSTQIKGQIIRFYSAFIDLYFLVGVGIWLSIVYTVFKYVPTFHQLKKKSKQY